MEIKGILFDKDGTIIDFYEVWGKAAEPVVDRLIEKYKLGKKEQIKDNIMYAFGIKDGWMDPEGALAWKTYPLIAQDLSLMFQLEFPEVEIDSKTIEADLKQFFFEEAIEKRLEYPCFTNMRELMMKLEAMNIKTGIATTDELNSTKLCIERLHIEPWISVVGSAGCGMPEKPDKKLLFYAAKQWRISPKQIAVVGDTPNDMRFAQNAGATAIAVLSGVGTKKDLSELSDYMIDSIDQLVSLVESINQMEES